MSQVFISYSRVDSEFVELFIERLEQAFPKLTIWHDSSPHGLIGGDNWWDEILRAIDDSDIFIYILSNEAIQSAYCQAEFTEARRLQKRIITIQARDRTDLTDELDDIQFIDMKNGVDNPESLMRVTAAVNKQLALAKKQRPLWKGKTPKPEKEKLATRRADAPEVVTPPLAPPVAEQEALKVAKDGLRWQIILGLATVVVTLIVGLLPFISEQLRSDREEATVGARTQAVLALTPTLNPVQQVQTLDARATVDAETVAIARQTQTAQAQLDNEASATAQGTLDAEASAIARINSYVTATALASVSPTLTNTPTTTPSLTNTPNPTAIPTATLTYTPTITPSLTSTPRPTRTPTMIPTDIPVGSVVIDEDFEDGFAQGFQLDGATWRTVNRENNIVYYTNGGTAFFGNAEWENYSVEYSFRLVDCPVTDCEGVFLWFRIPSDQSSYYVIRSVPAHGGFVSIESADSTGWHTIVWAPYIFETDTWYTMRLEAENTELRIYVNNDTVLATEDNLYTAGYLALGVFTYQTETQAEFDNIKVTYLGDN